MADRRQVEGGESLSVSRLIGLLQTDHGEGDKPPLQ